MSPEQATGRRFLIDHRTDIYSLGVTLYELVTQSVPFPGSEPHELLRQVSFDEPKSVRSANPAIPEELDVVITKAISRNPQDRYESAHEFCDDLHRFATGRPIQAKRASLAKLASRWMGRHQGLVISASIICIVTLVASLITSGVIWSAYESVISEKEIAKNALDTTSGLLLNANSQLIRSKDPALALALAVEGARHASGPEVNSTLLSALSETYERKTIYLKDRSEGYLDLSPDGRQAVTLSAKQADDSRSAVLIETKQGEIVRNFGSQITDAKFHPSGNFVVTASSKGLSNEQGKYFHHSERAQLWHVRKPDTKVVLLDSAPMRLQHESFSRDGRLLVLPSIDNTVSIYDGFSGERKVVFQKHEAQVIQAVLSADGNRVASLDVAGQLIIWDPSQGSPVGQVSSAISINAEPTLALTADGKYAIVATNTGTSCYDFSQSPPKKIHNWREPGFAMRPNHLHGACFWKSANRIQVRDLVTGQTVSNVPLELAPSSVTYTADGRYLVVAMEDKVVVIEPHSGKELFGLKGHKRKVLSVSMDDAFQSIVTSGDDQSVRIWSTKSLLEQNSLALPALLPIPTRDHFASFDHRVVFATGPMIETAVLDPKSQRLRRLGPGKINGEPHQADSVILFEDKYVRAFDSATSRKIGEVSFPKSRVTHASRCGDTNNVLIQLKDDQWFVWNIVDNSIRRFQVNRNQLSQRALSPDDNQVALLGDDGLCTVHTIPEGKLSRVLPHEELVTAVAWSKNRGIFTLDNKGVLQQWDIANQDLIARWSVKDLKANSLMVHEASDQIIAFHGSQPQKISSWNMETGELKQSADGMARMTLKAHPELPQILITSSEQGTNIWDLNDGSLSELSKQRSIAGEFLEDAIVVAEIGIEKHSHNHPSFFRSEAGTSSIVYFDNATRQPIRSIPLNRKPVDVCMDSNRQSLLVSYTTWHAAFGDGKSSTLELSPSFASNVSVIRHLSSGDNFLIASTDGTAFLVDSTGKSIRSLVPGGPPILAGAVSRDSKQCAFGDLGGGMRVIDLETGMVTHVGNVHQQAIRQIEFVDQDSGLLSLCEEGRVLRTSLADQSTKDHLPETGVRSFSMLADGSRALLVLGIDNKVPPRGGATVNIAAIAANERPGKAELLSVADMTTKVVWPEDVLCGDVDPVTARLGLISASGKVVIVDANTLNKLKEWNVRPGRYIALRWIGKDRLAALSTKADITIWNTLDGQRQVEIESPVNVRSIHMSFRDQWMPLGGTGEMLIGLGRHETFQTYPQNIYEYAQRNSPRRLTVEESLTYLNPLTVQPEQQ
jgi:WD40 repeat protein